MARPKALDPKVQKAIYPAASQWERVEQAARDDGKKPAEMAAILLELGLNQREAMLTPAAD